MISLSFLTLGIFLLLIWSLYVSKFDLINPAVLVLAVWFLSSFLAIFFVNDWNVEVSFSSTLIQLSCLSALTIPCILINYKTYKQVEMTSYRDFSNFILFSLLVYVICSYFLVIKILTDFAVEWGYSEESQMSLLQFVRFQMTHNDDVHLGRIFPFVLRLNFALGCIAFYIFCENLFLHSKNKKKLLLLLLLSIIPLYISVLSSGRTLILAMIVAYLAIYLVKIGKIKAWSDHKKMKRLLYILISIPLSFIVIFILIGMFALNRFGDGEISSIYSNLAMYLSSSIALFSVGLENISFFPDGRFGEYSFNSIYGTLKGMGLIENFISPFLLPVNIGEWNSNVYTANFRYVLDFGVSGAILVNLLIGSLLGVLYHIIKFIKIENFILFSLYFLLLYGIMMSFFDEQLFFNINNFIFRWLFILLIYYSLTRRVSNNV